MGGTPVFAATWVQIQSLVDFLTTSDRINDYLEGFPTCRLSSSRIAGRVDPQLVTLEAYTMSHFGNDKRSMNEIIFLVEQAAEGGFNARALGVSIFTDAADLDELRENIRDAVACHFEPEQKPSIIRLHFVTEEVIAA